MAIKIAFANQKGGVGKTSTLVHVAGALAHKAYYENPADPRKILVVDMDSQCNAQLTLSGGAVGEGRAGGYAIPQHTLADFLQDQTAVSLFESIVPASSMPVKNNTLLGNLYYIYSSQHTMSRANAVLASGTVNDAPFRLTDLLREVEYYYDYILIDTSPTPGTYLTLVALVAAEFVVIPFELATTSLYGLNNTIKLIDSVKRYNSSIQALGGLPSRVKRTWASQKDVFAFARRQFPGLILPPVYERAVLQEAMDAGMDIFSYKPAAKATELISADEASKEFGRVFVEIEKRLARH